MGRGRHFVQTEKGRLGLAPAVGIKAGPGERDGSEVVILHGSIVPDALENVNEEKEQWALLGDCYVENVMNDGPVDWHEDDTQEFVLIPRYELFWIKSCPIIVLALIHGT